MMFAFTTATSNATIPLSIDTLDKKIGVSKKISSFTIPLGATINMDGTSIMQGVAVIFIAQVYGMELTPAQLLTVIATAMIASIGTAGIPSVGLIMLAMVLTSVGLPTEGIALIMGIDRILDMLRTAVNITGDAVCTTIVSSRTKNWIGVFLIETKALSGNPGGLSERLYYLLSECWAGSRALLPECRVLPALSDLLPECRVLPALSALLSECRALPALSDG